MTARPFDDVPRTARGHLGLLFYEAAFAVIGHVRARAGRSGHAPERVFDQFPSLADYVKEVRRRMPDGTDWHGGARWLREQIDEWCVEAGPLPLRSVQHDLGIGRESLVMLAVLGLVEEDAAFAELFAALQAPLGHRRPTLGLLRELTHEFASDETADAWTLCRPLVDAGLAEVLNSEAPRSEWLLRVPPPIWTAVRGDRPSEPLPGLALTEPDRATTVGDLIVTDRQRGRLRHVQTLLEVERVRTLVVRGMAGCERTAIVGAVAAAAGRGVLEVSAFQSSRDERLTRIGPLCTLLQAIPVFSPDLGPSETFAIPTLAGYSGPVAVVLGREGGLSDPREAVSIDVDPDPPPQRLQHWRRALAGREDANLERIADTFALSGAHIRKCAPLAAASARLDGREAIAIEDVRLASRTITRQLLESLATPLEPASGGWGQLVAAAGTDLDLRDLERRCRHRERLASTVGGELPGGLNRGVRALFEGPSGCGKTLGARALASQVGLDVYRVDLASVINKFIGETEKNLGRILGRAEGLPVILLLDEGDALLARRTDIKSSNDRYANLETNYLLQRLETYDGIVIITTNLGAQIDPAFRRRMDVVVKFHLPDAEQRWRLWQLHLPKEHAVDPGTIEEVALRHAMTGGQIRNAMVHAALSALSRGGRIERADLVAAIELEHRKAGASFRRDERRERDSDDALDRFVSAIS